MSTQPEALRVTAEMEPPIFTDCTFSNEVQIDARELAELRADAQRFRTLCETSPVLCFMGQDYRSADKFRAAIDAYAKERV